MILTYFYLSNIFNAGQYGINTFTEVKYLNTSSTTGSDVVISFCTDADPVAYLLTYKAQSDYQLAVEL